MASTIKKPSRGGGSFRKNTKGDRICSRCMIQQGRRSVGVALVIATATVPDSAAVTAPNQFTKVCPHAAHDLDAAGGSAPVDPSRRNQRAQKCRCKYPDRMRHHEKLRDYRANAC